MADPREEYDFALLDARYHTDPDRASVYIIGSRKECLEAKREWAHDGVLVRVTEIEDGPNGSQVIAWSPV